MALLNDYLEKDLHLFDLKTLLEDVDRFSELSSPELHYFCLVDNMVLCIMRSHTRYRLWSCHWLPKTLFRVDGKPVLPVKNRGNNDVLRHNHNIKHRVKKKGDAKNVQHIYALIHWQNEETSSGKQKQSLYQDIQELEPYHA